MQILWFNKEIIIPDCEPIYAAIEQDGTVAYVGLADEVITHQRMLQMMKGSNDDINMYYRIVFTYEGADWLCACPDNYKGIENSEERKRVYRMEGQLIIEEFLELVRVPKIVEIPKRYRI